MCLKKIVTFFPIKIPQKATATNCSVQSSSSHKPRRVTCVSHQNHFLLIDLLSPPKAFINLRLIDNDLIFTVTKLKKKTSDDLWYGKAVVTPLCRNSLLMQTMFV